MTPMALPFLCRRGSLADLVLRTPRPRRTRNGELWREPIGWPAQVEDLAAIAWKVIRFDAGTLCR